MYIGFERRASSIGGVRFVAKWLVINLVVASFAAAAVPSNVAFASLPIQEGGQPTAVAGSSPRDGDLRLVGGPSGLEGQLEVFYNGTFGLVCDDRFTNAAAVVACRQLGLSGGQALCCGRYGLQEQQGLSAGGGSSTASSNSSPSSSTSRTAGSDAPAAGFHLDEVICKGSEASLAACDHNAWGFHDCGASEAVAISCTAPPEASDTSNTPDNSSSIAQPYSSVGPAIRCLASGSNRTGNCRGFDPVWFYYGGDTVDVVYRIVYRYANGAHSCPAPLTLRTSSEDYKYSMVAWSMDRTASPPGKRTIMVQRKGHIGKLYGVGPAWLTDLWIDVTDTVDDGSSDVVSAMDRTNGYDPTTGELDVAGPAVAGWRWKHGSVGLTSLYVPETFPELTATNGAGINATYQLVYELWTTQATTDFLAYSYPGPLRFTVHHPRSSTPLLIYVQLESVVHPANLAALLLQRVEGDSVWTVARLPPESNEIKLQQQMLLFRDETNIQGWGCPPSVAPPAGLGSPDASKDAMNSSGQTMVSPSRTPEPPMPASSRDGDSSASSSQQQAAAARSYYSYACSLLLQGCGQQASTDPITVLRGVSPCISRAELHCSAVSSNTSSSTDPPDPQPDMPLLQVEVGRQLLAHLNYSGVEVVPRNASLMVAAASANIDQHWGISILGQTAAITLQHSWVSGLPLSQGGPLVECRECLSFSLLNVTLQDLQGKVAAEDRSAAGTNSSSKPPPQQTVGAMLVTGARDVRLEGFSCQHVTGATAWSCLAVEYAAVEDLMVKPTAPIYSLIMEDTHVLENSVSPAVEAGMAALAQGQVDTVVRALLNMTSLNGAGAVVLLAHNATTTAANTSTTVDIHIQQSDLSYNTGGAGSVLFLGPGLEGDMVLARTSINHNNASGNGGAICTMGFLQSLKLTRGSSFDGNSAAAQGGAVYAPLGYGLFSLDSSSASGNQASEGGIMASGLNAGNVTITNGSRMDHNMAAQACPLLSAWVQSADLPPADYGGANVTIRASSVSHNNGGLRAFTFFILRSLTVTDAIIEGGSVSLTHVGWYPVPSFDRDLYFIHIERSHFINAVNLYTGFITWCAANVHELRILDSVIERNSVLASGVLGSGYLFSNVLIRNTSISHNMINRTDASYGAVLASFASAGNVTFEDVVIRNNTGGRYGGFNVAQLGSLTISGPRTVMEGFVNGFFIVDESAGAITISDGALIRDNVDLSGARSGGFIQIAKNAGDITIDNATLLNGMAGINGGFIYVANDVVGSIRMSNARVEGHSAANGAGGLIAVGGNVQGVVEITNSRICGCQAKTSGGALYIQSGVFGGIFLAGANTSLCGNRALTGSGGAIAGGFTVPVAAVSDGAQLLDNKAEVDGGAVWASGLLGNVTISRGARVARNSAAENGGAFAAGFIAGLELRDGGEAIGNAAGVDGGLVWADRLTSVWIRGASATSNSAGNSGGVLAVNTLPDLVEMDGAVLSENRAKQGGGGAISVRVPVPGSALLSQVSPSGQALFSITGGSALSGNYAYMDGGVISIIAEQRGNAIDAVSNAPQIQLSVRMETSDFRANKAGGAGGAVFVSAPALGAVRVAITALQCRFTRNTAGSSVFERGSTIDSGYGGAVAATSTPKYRAMAMLESAEQQQQWAYGTSSSGSSSRGAAALAYLDSACSLLLQGCGFEDNTALGNGGAVSVVSCPTRVTQSSFTRNTAQFSGGGLSSQVESLDIASVLGAAQRQQQERRRLQQQPQPLPLKPSESNPWLQVHDSNFSNNTAIGACGGGLHVEFGRGEGASVARCQFSRNTAASASGGAMCLQARGSSGRAAVADCSFRGNSAAELGGGVLAELGGGGGGHRLLLSRLTMQSDAAGRAGGAVALTSISAASALTLRDSSISNSSSLQGGAIYAQCSATPNSAAASGGEGALASATAGSCSSGGGDVLSIYNSTISRCLARGSGGGLYLAAGTTATVQNCTFTANTAVLSGGAVRGSECARLSLERVAVQGGSAGQLGGGVASTCAVLLLNGSSITSNSALTGGGLALSGPGVAAGSAEQQTAARSTATIINVRLASNSAGSSSSSSSSSSSGGSSTATGSSGSSTQQAAAYVRYGGHGGGAFIAGNISVLLRDVDMSVANSAVTGTALASTQACAASDAAAGSGMTLDVCWRLTLQDVMLPAQEAPSVWLQDTDARALHVNCSGISRLLGDPPAASAREPCTAALAASNTRSDAGAAQLLQACLLEAQLGQCVVPAVGLLRDGAGAAGSSAHSNSLLDAPPTHMRLASGQLESSDGWLKLSAGTAFQLSVQMYNSLVQALQTDTMEWSITVGIRPLQLSANNNNATVARPWGDPNLANLDPDPAAGGSLTAEVVGGVATWPRLKVRGWVGPYELFFRAYSPSDATLYQVSDLVVRARILPCMEGEALDLSWAQQSWGQPSWVSCARCSGGQFTLWRDNRPSLSDIDTPHYMQLMMELSQAAAASQAACLRCPNNAICPGGRLLVPNPGYWHSAQDSALLHRCPQQAACGNPMDGRRWPEIHRTQSTAATTLTNANASLSSGLSTGDLPGLSYDARSEWLIVCHQQLGTSSGGGGGTLEVAGNSTSSLVATEAAAAACGSAGGGGYMQLQCAVGYGGNLCATCTPGYFQDSELSCTSCPSLAYTVVIAILALLGTTLLILYTSYVTFEEQITLSRTCSNSLHKPNEKETSAADILKVLIVHVQFYVIVTRLSVPYPDSVSRLAAVTTAITGSENAFVYSHACFVSGLDSEGQARSQLAGTLITPFVVLFLSLLAWLLRRTVSKCLGPALPRAAGQPPQHLAHHQQANILYSRGALEPRGSAAGPARQSPGATIDEEPLPTPTGSDASALYAASAAAVSPTEQLQPQPPFSHGIRASEGGGSAFVTGGGLGAAAAKRAVTSGGGGLLSTATSLRLLGTEGAAVVDFAEDDCRDVSEPLAEATPPKPLRTVLSYAGSSGGTADAHTPSSASAAANVKDAADALAPPLSSAPSAQRRRTQDAAAAATPQGLHTCASGSVMPPPSAFALVQAPSLRGRLSLLRSVDSRPGTPHAPALVTSPSLRTIGSGKLQTALSSISRIPVVAGISESISESYQKSGVRRILSLLDSSLTLGEQLLVVLMITVFIVYPGWANATLSAFTCYIIDDGSTGLFPERQQATWPYGYWIRNMNLQCYTGTHLAVYVPVGVVSFVVLCLAPPVASFAILWRRRRQLTEPQVQLRYGFLYSRYKRRFWYWGSVQMLQQLLLVAVEMFGRALTQVDQQIAVLLVTFTLMALINMACSPAKSRLLTLLDFFSLAVLILTLSLSLFFVTADPLEPAQADAVGILIIAINAALLVSFAALLLRRTWLAVQEKLDKRLRKMWSRVATFKHIRDGAQEVTVEPAAQGHAPGDGLLDPDGQQRAAGANLLPPPPPLQPAASGPPLQPAASGSPLPQSYSATAVLASAAAATQAAASTASAADAGRPREGQQVVLPLPPHPLPAGRMKVVRVGQPPVRPTSSTAQPASYLLHQTSSSTAPKTGTAGHAPGSWSTSQAASQPPSQSSSQPPSQPPSQPSSQPPSQPPSQPSSSQPISTGQPTRLCGQPPRPGVQVTRPELPQVPPQPPQLLQPLFNQQAGGGARARPADQDPTPFALLQHMESLT